MKDINQKIKSNTKDFKDESDKNDNDNYIPSSEKNFF